jgi:tetratricopeptide (TPR) repeat protein
MQKAPAMAAEPHRLRLLNLIFVPWTVFPVDEHPETQTALLREKAKAAVRAAKADPHDGHAQLNAALAYRQMFDLLQEQGDHAMSFAQLRDAAQASGFATAGELRDWLARAAGKNLRLLDAAWACAQKSLCATPLEGGAYICLAELSCLHDPAGALEQRLLAQALAVRPYDPDILFAAGREALLLDREEQALDLLRRAFRYGPVFQKRVAELLAADRDGEFFRQTFDPDWQALSLICDAFRTYDRTDELHALLQHSAAAAAAFAREQPDEQQAAPAWLVARDAWNELQQPQRAIQLLQEAVQQHPHSFAIRSALGKDLYHAERFAEAATHLRWASSRKPEDQYLKSLAGLAVRAALQTAPAAPRVTPAAFERVGRGDPGT